VPRGRFLLDDDSFGDGPGLARPPDNCGYKVSNYKEAHIDLCTSLGAGLVVPATDIACLPRLASTDEVLGLA
jgi:hypothetical protein